MEKVKEMLTEIVQLCFERAKESQKAEGHITSERGFATIPLPSIDVPFHSPYLWAGVMPFRACGSFASFQPCRDFDCIMQFFRRRSVQAKSTPICSLADTSR